jgi:hypothetical protein
MAVGGSAITGIAGLSAAVLAVLGLVGMLPEYMAAIAVIAIGGALIFEGGAVAARFSAVLSDMGAEVPSSGELGGGMTAEFVGGATGVVLGILALLGIQPAMLVSASIIVFGGALVLGSRAAANAAMLGNYHAAAARDVAREAVGASMGAQVLIGVGAIVLGILAVTGAEYRLTLTLAALLGLGVALALSGTAIASRMSGAARA